MRKRAWHLWQKCSISASIFQHQKLPRAIPESSGIGQVGRYHVQGLPDLNANPDIETLIQIIVGTAIAIALGYVFGLQSKNFMTLKSTGAVIGVLFLHNAVHLCPKLFAALTSPMWVNQVVSHTQVGSMLWRGISFVF